MLFVGYQYVAIISKKAHRTHQEGPKSHHRREIADGLSIEYVDIFGINSKKIMIFWELIPKKLYICSGK